MHLAADWQRNYCPFGKRAPGAPDEERHDGDLGKVPGQVGDARLETGEVFRFAACSLGEKNENIAPLERRKTVGQRMAVAPPPATTLDWNGAQDPEHNPAGQAAAAKVIGGGHRPHPQPIAKTE